MKTKLNSILAAAIIFALLYITGAFGSQIAFGKVTTNTDLEWKVSFTFLHGDLNGFLTPKQDSSKISITTKLDNGKVSFFIYDSHKNLIGSFSGKQIYTLEKLKKNEMYRIKATAKIARGSFNVAIE